MSLRQVDKSGYSRFVDSAKRCTANRVYPMSIAEGYLRRYAPEWSEEVQ